MIPVYHAGRQLVKVRTLMILSLLAMCLCLWWAVAVELKIDANINENEAPTTRLAWACVVAVIGTGFAAGMWLYGRHYAARIDFHPETGQVHLHTVGFFCIQRHVIDRTDFGATRPHPDPEASMRKIFLRHIADLLTILGQAPTANAPWRSVQIKGWRLPLLIDEGGRWTAKASTFLRGGTMVAKHLDQGTSCVLARRTLQPRKPRSFAIAEAGRSDNRRVATCIAWNISEKH